MTHTIYQVDAFAKNVFSGNPAAVVPLETWPPDELMQNIALENNLSETAFFVKNYNLSLLAHQSNYHIRWFTPEYEIDLCGHATLASAFIIKNYLEPGISDMVFSTQKAGALKAT